jgi:hypothetical protein
MYVSSTGNDGQSLMANKLWLKRRISLGKKLGEDEAHP